MEQRVFPGDVPLTLIPSWFVFALCAMIGLIGGSFLNVVIYRLPRELSVAFPGSQCPHCGEPIRAWQNVPVLSWLFLRGKSRCCRKTISPRYPAVELISGLMACSIVAMKIEPQRDELSVMTAGLLFVSYLIFSLGLLAAAAIDWEHMILPHSLTWGAAGLGLASSWFRPEVSPMWSVLGALIGYIGIWFPFIWLHEKLRGFPGMGEGDANLMAAAGAWFGPVGALLTLFMGAVQGTLFAIAAIAAKGKIEEPPAVTEQRNALQQAIEEATGEEKEALQRELELDPLGLPPEEAEGGPRVAFGPFLALSLVELLLLHEPIMIWLETYLLM